MFGPSNFIVNILVIAACVLFAYLIGGHTTASNDCKGTVRRYMQSHLTYDGAQYLQSFDYYASKIACNGSANVRMRYGVVAVCTKV